jgi:general stress protein CsbA
VRVVLARLRRIVLRHGRLVSTHPVPIRGPCFQLKGFHLSSSGWAICSDHQRGIDGGTRRRQRQEPQRVVVIITPGLCDVLFSNIGDTYGRKKAIVLRVVLMWLSLMGIGCLPTYYDIGVLATVLLAVMRLLQGAVSRRRVCG